MQTHNGARTFVALVAAIALTSACTKSGESTDATVSDEPTLDLLVTTEWLSEHLDDPITDERELFAA